MKIVARMGHWSSVVGGGVLLADEKGRMIGQIAFLCHDDMMRDKDMQERLSRICCDAINAAAESAAWATTEATPLDLRAIARAALKGDNDA